MTSVYFLNEKMYIYMLRYLCAVLKQAGKRGLKFDTNIYRMSVLTVLVEQQSQVLSVVGADVEEESWTLVSPEAQRDVFCSQGHVRVEGGGGGGHGTGAPVRLVHHLLLEDVADGGC